MSTASSASSSKVLHVAKARHGYKAQVADQLTFTTGDMLHIVAKNGGWWMGVKVANPAERGWVPSNYLSVLDEKTGQLEKVQVTPRTQAGQVRPETAVQLHAVGGVSSASPVSSTQLPSTNGKELLYGVKALHKFSATQTDGLSFEAGELMSIIGKKDGWLRGVNLEGKEGWIPSNYVKEILREDGVVAANSTPTVKVAPKAESNGVSAVLKLDTSSDSPAAISTASPSASPSSAASNQTAASSSPAPEIPAIDPNLTARFDAPTPRAPELPTDAAVNMTPRAASLSDKGSRSGSETPEEEYRDQVSDLTITPRMQQSIGASQEKVRALFNFDAKKPDHLSFKKGDIMVVIKKKQGWWKVHHENFSGKLGYIPSNYVKACVEADPVANPVTSVLTPSGAVATVPVDFEPTKDRPLLVKATHSYKALANNQLSFNKHDLLHVIHKNKQWWKAYRLADSEKIGYIPSNYVKVQGPGDNAASKEASKDTTSNSTEGGVSAISVASPASSPASSPSAASAPVQLEEVAIALHDLEKRDPKCLSLKRDERFTIMDKSVGGGWWRCTSQSTLETGLVPSNFVRVEMAPKRTAPPLPPTRGSVPNVPTVFVEGSYDFNAKKSSQLSLKKYESLVILKKDGSWWKARNRAGKEGVVPYNYVKEVYPSFFTALFDYHPTASSTDGTALVAGQVVAVLDMDAPGWWLVETTNGKGFVPSNYLFPNSTRVPGQLSTPRAATAPEVPATPRNPDGTLRNDPPAGINPVAASIAEPALKIESGSTLDHPGHQRRYSGSLTVSPLSSNKDTAQIVASKPNVASVVMQAHHFASPSQTPRPEFITGQPSRPPPRVSPEEREGKSSMPPPASASTPAKPISFSSAAYASPAGTQVEGHPNPAPQQFGFEGEGEQQPEGKTNDGKSKDQNVLANTYQGPSTSSDSSSATNGKKEIGATNRSAARGNCSSGWSFLGIFGNCGGNRGNENIPKPEPVNTNDPDPAHKGKQEEEKTH